MHRDELAIDEPCNADWNAMEPRGKGRHCVACALDVVDVSALEESEARDLAARLRSGSSPMRVCVSYVVRRDGTIRLASPRASVVAEAVDVPASALVRRGRSMIAAAAMAMAACQPLSDATSGHVGKVAQVLPPPPPVEVRLGGAPRAIDPPPASDAGVSPTPASNAPTAPSPPSEPPAPCETDSASTTRHAATRRSSSVRTGEPAAAEEVRHLGGFGARRLRDDIGPEPSDVQ